MIISRSRKVISTFAIAAAMLGVATVALSDTSDVDPDAARVLKEMTDYLAGLQRFSVKTKSMLDEVTPAGQKIQREFSTDVLIRRPNEMRAVRQGDPAEQILTYDGSALTVYDSRSNYSATAAAPATIDDMLHFAREALDIVPPAGDMLFTNAYDLLTAGVTSGVVVGKATIGDVSCDHLAFTSPLVDWEIWIADSEKPLPCKYVLTTKDDPAHPQYIVLMSQWNVAPDIGADTFVFAPPSGATEIEFIRMDESDISGQ